MGDYIYPAFDLDQFSTKFYLSQYAELLTNSQSGANAIPSGQNRHVYTSFQWVIDEETLGFNQLIGYIMNTILPGERPLNNLVLSNFIKNQNKIIIDCSSTVDGSGNWTYTLSSATGSPKQIIPFPNPTIGQFGYPATYIADLQPIKSLYVRLKNYTTSVRAPFLTLSQSDVLAIVPVDAQYGEQINFVVQNWIPAYNDKLNLNQLNIDIVNERGQFVDFQGVNWDMTLIITFAANSNAVAATEVARPENHPMNSVFQINSGPPGTNLGAGLDPNKKRRQS